MTGCTRHRAYIYDRGAERRIGELFPLTQVAWNRIRDDTSTGVVFAEQPDRRCHEMISEIEPSRHELVIYRNGERVWEGPIVRTAEKGRQIEVDARDVTHYLNRTIMRSPYNNAYPRIVYGTERLRVILTRELGRREAIEPPINVLPYMQIRTSDDSAKTTRNSLPFEKYVFEELDSMAWKSGVDYTVVGRRLFINDVHDNIGEGPPLSEADFDGDLVVTKYGMETATYSAVTDGQGRYGGFGGIDSYYGLIELLHTSFEEGESATTAEAPTTAELVGQARRNIAGRYPTPTVLRVPDGSTLNPDTAEKIMDLLIPGVRCPVQATRSYSQIKQTLKLDRVNFVETARGEAITVTMSPEPGNTPWEDEGETSA
jgi:hypothetical protein